MRCCCVGVVRSDVVTPLPVQVVDSDSMKKYPVNPKDYNLFEEVGDGVSATVYRALCIPLNEIVAIKALDLERCNNDLDGIRREVKTMSLIEHPNVVKSYCSFSAGSSLWIVMPYMAGGSCLHIMKSSYPEGFEEPVIAILLHEVLSALAYLHSEGHIHRDVKAGNILIDSSGAVKLGDFGVSAGMFDSGDRQRARHTFTGTPCWMAPEVMQQQDNGYDFKADIWSLGITALELAHGHAPFSKFPPMKVLLMTLQNAPPGLDYERDKKFSKSFRDLVAVCLHKDPKKRPTSEKLLKHSFFRHARPKDLLARTILRSLPPLGDRYKTLKENELNVQLNSPFSEDEQLSQQKYMRGISAWDFNVEDLRREAALMEEFDSVPGKFEMRATHEENEKIVPFVTLAPVASIHDFVSTDIQKDFLNGQNVGTAEDMSTRSTSIEVGGCSNVCVEDTDQRSSQFERVSVFENIYSSVTDGVHATTMEEREVKEPEFQNKGRFKVVRSDTSPRDSLSTSMSSVELIDCTGTGRPISFSLQLQHLLRHNSMQKDEILRLIRYVNQEAGHMEIADAAADVERSEFSPAAARERDLLSQVMNVQQSVDNVTQELLTKKFQNDQLEKKLTWLRNQKQQVLSGNVSMKSTDD